MDNSQKALPGELLEFFKALADANRLKIVGLLTREELSGEQLAEMLGLSPSTVSHHLSKLNKVGLVSAKAEGYYSIYRFESKTLEDMARRLLASETLPAAAADVDLAAYDRKVLKSFLEPDGRIKAFPSQQKKLEVLLRYAAEHFEPGIRYPEKQVNAMLKELTEDTASLRRDLVDLGYLQREGGGGVYWRNAP